MKRDRLWSILAGGGLGLLVSVSASCLSTDLGPEVDPFAAAATEEPKWEVRGGIGTEDEVARTGGIDEEAFWRANAAEPGVTILPSSLRYRVIRAGDGPRVGKAPRIAASYVTSALDGHRIADSRDEGGPVELEVARLNPGWREAVPLMREGAIWRLYVPAALGRTPADLAPVRPRIYDVEIVRIMDGAGTPEGGRLP